MNNKCVFATNVGVCSILVDTQCTGFRSKQVCSFSKTKEEYIDGINEFIRINRKKGNCFNCKCRNVRCGIQETEADHEYYLAVSR